MAQVPHRPFRQGPFARLPETPRRPHPFFQAAGLDLHLPDTPLGAMKVHVRRFGAGPPLLLVHGLMTSSYSWRYVLEPLGRHFTCYAPDLPANGRTDAPQGPAYTPAALVGWLSAVQRALDIRGCAVVGNSMGGYLCMAWALEDPEAMSRLLNVHSPGIPELRILALNIALKIPGTHALLRSIIRRDPLRWAHRNVHYYDEGLKSLEEAREYGEPLRTREGAQGLVKYLSEAMAPGPMRELAGRLSELRAAGKSFPVPLLLMFAEQDPMVPPRFGRAFANMIPDAELLWLQEASHFAHVDAPEKFLAAAVPFLTAANQGSTAPVPE